MSPVYRGQHMLKRDEQGRKNLYGGLCVVMSCRSDYDEG
jgi:hypothetical protein